MGSERSGEQLLVDYLLGNLPENEQARVEDRAFADAECMAALEDAEADLIDAYVRGSLPDSERRAFERRFLVSPARRGKVEFARALLKVGKESTVAEAPSAWRRAALFFDGWRPAVQFAAACAALVVIAGSSWLLYENAAMRSRLAVAERRRAELDAKNQSLARQVEETRGGVTAPRGHVPALILLPGLSRAETRMEQLALPPSAQVAHIEIQLEPRDDYPQFRADLRTSGGAEVLTRANLRPARKGYARVVSFDVPASALESGQYELMLKGVGVDGSRVDVGYYYFAVNRQ